MKTRLSVHLLHFPVRSLGPGVRVGLWVQGCSFHCQDCLTPDSWPFRPEQGCSVEDLADGTMDFFRAGANPCADGLTVSGGEPFDQPEATLSLLRLLNKRGLRDILIYSGYERHVLLCRYPELPSLVAALIDGRFDGNAPTEATWKGSENQSFTLWRPEFEVRYRPWLDATGRKLQLMNVEGRHFLVGIPHMKDAAKLRTL